MSPRPGFVITPDQKQRLLTDGYAHLPGAFPAEILARWRDLADQLEVDALEDYRRGELPSSVCVIEDPVGPRLARHDGVLEADADAVIDLLACPAMMAVAREFCGRGVVPLQVDILYKHQHPHPVILWHQGATHPRGYPYLNVGVYLDDADAGDGCLQYIPGTQHELQDIAALAADHGWEIPGTIEQPAKAGDILVQDMMILHGSTPKRSPGVRRTVYIEFRPMAGIAESDVQSSRWAELRRRWMACVVRRAAREDWPEEWQGDLPNDLLIDEEELAAVVSRPEPTIPSVYSSIAVETTDYPVPSDLRESS